MNIKNDSKYFIKLRATPCTVRTKSKKFTFEKLT